MPISRKIFSKKRVKKSMKKNTRKYNKRMNIRNIRKLVNEFVFLAV